MTAIDLSLLEGKTIAVLGLGKSGLTAALALKAGGAAVLAWDDNAASRNAAARQGVAATDLRTAELRGVDMLVLSPGIPRGHPAPHPVVARALAAGTAIVNDIDLLGMARTGATFIGITGTNGKSTTTALVGHILRSAGRPTGIGGNLGTPALSLPALGRDGCYVLECSSYQLETIAAVRWDVGLLLNISPDHLDRYAGMDSYVAAKARLFADQPAGATAIVGVDDDWSRAVHATLDGRRRIVPVSVERAVKAGVHAVDGVLVDDLDGRAEPVLDLRPILALPGRHNWQNACAAYAAAKAAGVPRADIVSGLTSFPGLAHRQQLVATLDGVRFVNDSKATNPDAAAKALASYDTIYWIAGGRPKPGGFDALSPYLGRIAHAFLIGEGTETIAAYLDGRVTYERCGDLGAAVPAAHRRASADRRASAVVLLSPACASFDQFANFERRGEAFTEAVHRLTSAAPLQQAGGAR